MYIHICIYILYATDICKKLYLLRFKYIYIKYHFFQYFFLHSYYLLRVNCPL